MSQFFAHERDEQRCRHSLAFQRPITVTGLTLDGKERPFTGVVQSVERGHTTYAHCPLLVTMSDTADMA